jgi:hypothetical protein
LPGGEGSPPPADVQVRRLLECRAFLWDVLTDGEWTGCSRGLLRKLTALYGPEKILTAFGEE